MTGRPSKYDPAFCDRVEELGRQGASVLECALELGVCKQTLFNWQEEHPEFLDALTRARAHRQVWWERVHRKCAQSGEGNAASIQFGLKNIAPEDYADKVDLNHGGQADNPMRAVTRIELVGVRPDDDDAQDTDT
jgi:transposase